MSIVTFWNGTKEQSGTTFSAIAFAVQSAIQHNMKILLISTSFNDTTTRDCFWKSNIKKSIFGSSAEKISNNGIEGLELLMRGGKITPNRIPEYTGILLRDRLEVLTGVESSNQDLYDKVKEKYGQIISLAKEYYNLVVVDLDRRLNIEYQRTILGLSDIIVPVVTQKAKDIQMIQELINQNDILNRENTVITIGRYMEDTKYNAKNITRNILKSKDIINVVPYNNLLFEAAQEGRVIDIFFDFMKIRERDINYRFTQELNRLFDTTKGKNDMLKMKRGQ